MREGRIFNLTMDVDTGFKLRENRGGFQSYMMESEDFSSKISFTFLRNGNKYFKGQLLTLRL